MKIYKDLDTVIENITETNPEYTHLKNLAKEEFQKADKENFEKTLKFIDKNEIVERMNEMMSPPSISVSFSGGGNGHVHN